MEVLERIWESISLFVNGLLGGFERSVTSLFGSSNAREVKRMQAKVEAINSLESRFQGLSDEQLRQQSAEFRERLRKGESLDDILVEAFAVCREGGRRFLGMRHYDVQLIGGMVLHGGSIAEMVTGEGKTLVATLPAYLNALEGRGVHVVTVNDYLARRDMEWMAPLYMGLGLTVGTIQSDMPVADRQKAYSCDITYGTNNEFGFDYLRDNMRPAARGDDAFPKSYQQSQGPLHFAIVDEVDNILIDEARTPLIISGPAHSDIGKYADADRIARQLRAGEHFEVSEKDHSVTLTDDGVRAAERLAGVESFYTAGNMEWPHLIDNSLKAHHLYKRDVNYVVKEGKVIIVDEFTGRLMDGRQWSDGLHQAVEAKEGVKIKEETQTLATITLQNFFKLYKKICGMTGTAMTEANEFWKIYHLDVIAIPTNRHMQRIEHPDKIFVTEEEKYHAIAEEIERLNRFDVVVRKEDEIWGTVTKEDDERFYFQPRGTKETLEFPRATSKLERRGRPVLVGTTSIEKSERISELLERRNIKHEVLNAKHHRREAEIVAQAGRMGAVTIATNMAGRGTDIILGGNAETMAWAILQDKYPTRLDVPTEEWDQLVEEIETRESMREQGQFVKGIGGLHVIGTERHEARRIDLQLRGRCGRQGDPGSSRFYLSLKDDLMRIFAGPWVEKILKSLGLPEGEPIESRMVTRRIEAAQKKVEERNFEIRKNLLEYDEVMDEQRKRVYSYRQAILDGENCKGLIMDMIEGQVNHFVRLCLAKDYSTEVFASYAGNQLATPFSPRDFRGLDFAGAVEFAKDEAERAAESQIVEAIEENLPDDSDPNDWNWDALAKFINVRWQANLRGNDLKRFNRDEIETHLLQRAVAHIQSVELSEGSRFLDDNFGVHSACAWVQHKFGIEVKPEDYSGENPQQFIDQVRDLAMAGYEQRESEYAVMTGLSRFSGRDSSGNPRVDREALADWASKRFDVDVSLEDIKTKQRDEIRSMLLSHSRAHRERGENAEGQIRDKLASLFGTNPDATLKQVTGGNGALSALTRSLHDSWQLDLAEDELADLDRDQLERRLIAAVDDRFRPEMRRMERGMLLHIVDEAWKDHLLAMDHLRSSVSLVGYAQVDPKVEYKREGMKLFEQMWESIAQRTTELVFRMEMIDDGFVSSTFVETAAVHRQAPSATEMVSEQQAAIENSGTSDAQIETIRNVGSRVGRNDPCPCGSGKKYKNCCLRKQAGV